MALTKIKSSNILDGTIANVDLGSGVGAGKVLQVVSFTESTTATSSAGSTWVMGVEGSITMSSTSNKLLALSVGRGEMQTSTTYIHGGVRLKTSGSGVTAQIHRVHEGDDNNPFGITHGDSTSGQRLGFAQAISYMFTPSYAGAVTVTFEGSAYNTSNSLIFNRYGGQQSELILMEIAG
jgi:hypothetical protein